MLQLRVITHAAVLTLCLVMPFAYAEERSPAPPCTSDGASNFDFWLGEWEAYESNDGSVQSWGTASLDEGRTWQTAWDITYRRGGNND
jgi:hypothetical protein